MTATQNEKRDEVYTTRDELMFLKVLKKRNPSAFEKYKMSFYTRKDWGKIKVGQIARFLGLTQKPKKK